METDICITLYIHVIVVLKDQSRSIIEKILQKREKRKEERKECQLNVIGNNKKTVKQFEKIAFQDQKSM